MADLPPEKSLDDFFAKRDKKKKKEKGKGKESTTGPTSAVIKKTKREKEKSAKNDNQDTQIEKVTLANATHLASFPDTGVVSNVASPVTMSFLLADAYITFRQLLTKTMRVIYIFDMKGEKLAYGFPWRTL